MDELPGPSSFTIPSATSCQQLPVLVYPGTPTLNGSDSSGDKRNRTAGEYWDVEKERRRDEITVGMEKDNDREKRRTERGVQTVWGEFLTARPQ